MIVVYNGRKTKNGVHKGSRGEVFESRQLEQYGDPYYLVEWINPMDVTSWVRVSDCDILDLPHIVFEDGTFWNGRIGFPYDDGV